MKNTINTINEIDELQKKIQQSRVNIINEKTKLNVYIKKYEKLKIKALENSCTVTTKDIKYLIEYDRHTEVFASEKLTELLEQFYSSKCRYPGSLSVKGYWRDTQQKAIQITVLQSDTDKELKKIADGINILCKYIKHNKEGFQIFTIFERTLSEDGAYYLYVRDGIFYIMICSGNRRTQLSSHDTAYEALKEIQKNYYYSY